MLNERFYRCFTCRKGPWIYEEGEDCGDCQYKTDPEYRRMVDGMRSNDD